MSARNSSLFTCCGCKTECRRLLPPLSRRRPQLMAPPSGPIRLRNHPDHRRDQLLERRHGKLRRAHENNTHLDHPIFFTFTGSNVLSPVDEQDAVQMIQFVLQCPSQQVLSANLLVSTLRSRARLDSTSRNIPTKPGRLRQPSTPSSHLLPL